VYWVEDGSGRVLLRRRPEKGLLGGMLEVPGGDWTAAPSPVVPPVVAAWRLLPDPVEHTFTHFHLTLAVHSAREPAAALPGGGDWRLVAKHDLAGAALPSVMRKVVAKVLGAAAPKPRR
jgi:A/G-specific adenine glycosylase